MTRYKVKVEHDGAPGAGFDQATTKTVQDADPSTSTSTSSTPAINTSNSTADVASGGRRVEAAGDAAAVGSGVDSGFANPTLAQVVLVPANEASAYTTKPDVADGEQQQEGRRTLVKIRGLKPATRYQIQVAWSFLWVSIVVERARRGGTQTHTNASSSQGYCLTRFFGGGRRIPCHHGMSLSREYSKPAHQKLRVKKKHPPGTCGQV